MRSVMSPATIRAQSSLVAYDLKNPIAVIRSYTELLQMSVVEKLGGRVGGNSAIGSGSTFWFTLPSAQLPSSTT